MKTFTPHRLPIDPRTGTGIQGPRTRPMDPMPQTTTLDDADVKAALQDWRTACKQLVASCEARDDALDSLIETQEAFLAELKTMRDGRGEP